MYEPRKFVLSVDRGTGETVYLDGAAVGANLWFMGLEPSLALGASGRIRLGAEVLDAMIRQHRTFGWTPDAAEATWIAYEATDDGFVHLEAFRVRDGRPVLL